MCNLEEKRNYCLLLLKRVFVVENREGVGIDGSDGRVLDVGLLPEGNRDEVGEVSSDIADGADDDEIGEGIRWDGDGGGVLDAGQAGKGECDMGDDDEIGEAVRWDGDGGGVLDAGQAGKGECDRDGEVICGDWEVEIERGQKMG